MISKPTVIILGAGASAAYGLPTGGELRRMLIFISDERYVGAFEKLENMIPDGKKLLRAFRQKFREAKVPSIDAYLADLDSDTAKLGQQIIACLLLRAEKLSCMIDGTLDSLFLSKADWMMTLFKLMDRDINRNNVHEYYDIKRLHIVTFNYDRSFEYALFLHLKHKFDIDDASAAEIVKGFPIHHIYGQLGDLRFTENGSGLPYGPDSTSLVTINAAAEKIKIIGNRVNDGNSLKAIQQHIKDAERVVFLGFGFDEQNIRHIAPDGRPKNENASWFASSMGMTEAHRRLARIHFKCGIQNVTNNIWFGDSSLDANGFLNEILDEITDY